MIKTNTSREHLQRAILETCDLCDIWSKSNPRDLWPLGHLIRVTRRHDLTKKKTMIKTNSKTKTMTKTNTFGEHLQRAILETCDFWDIWSEGWEDITTYLQTYPPTYLPPLEPPDNHLDWSSALLHHPIIERVLWHCLFFVGRNWVKTENQLDWLSAHLQQPNIKSGQQSNTDSLFLISLLVYPHWL